MAFGYGQAAKANAEWRRLLNGRTFHMTDLHNRKKDFEGIDDDEVDKIMLGVVAIIRKYAANVVAVSCDLTLLTEPFPMTSNSRDEFLTTAFRSPYAAMLYICMWAMGRFANNHSKGRREISYVLESGDAGQPAFVSYMQGLMAEPKFGSQLDHYSLSALTSKSKDQIEGVSTQPISSLGSGLVRSSGIRRLCLCGSRSQSSLNRDNPIRIISGSHSATGARTSFAITTNVTSIAGYVSCEKVSAQRPLMT